MNSFLDQIKNQDEYFNKIYDKIEKKNSSLKNLDKIKGRISRKDEQIMELNKSLNNIENSTTWKLLRKYDNFKKFFKKKNQYIILCLKLNNPLRDFNC